MTGNVRHTINNYCTKRGKDLIMNRDHTLSCPGGLVSGTEEAQI